jgi:hypothetical protein
MMKRRKFIVVAGGMTASFPFAAGAQQPAMPVIGYFSSRGPPTQPCRLMHSVNP